MQRSLLATTTLCRLPRVTRRSYHVVMMGSDDVSLPTLKALHESSLGRGPYPNLITKLRVLCPADRAGKGARGRSEVKPLPVKAYCLDAGIEDVAEVPVGLKDLAGAPQLIEGKDTVLQPFAADLGVVVSFGYFIPRSFLSRLRLGALNMHPSLLPKYRGAAPLPHAILNGDKETGVSVIEIDPERFDAGNILWQDERVPIDGSVGTTALRKIMAEKGSLAMLQTIAELEARRNSGRFKTQDQQIAEAGPSAAATLFPRAPKLHALQGLLSWSAEGHARALAQQKALHEQQNPGKPFPKAAFPTLPQQLTVGRVTRLFRAFDDSSFGLYSFFNGGKRMKLLAITVPETLPSALLSSPAKGETAQPGELAFVKGGTANGGLFLRLVDGWIRIDSVMLETKKAALSGADFANGYHIGLGSKASRLEDPPAG